jgi:hypothetical protein
VGPLATVLFSVATVVAPMSGALPPVHDPSADAAVVAQLVFGTDLDGFVKGRGAVRRRHPHLDWTTDGCSAPVVGSSGRSFNFRSACVRHDFAYRNLARLGLLDAAMRARVDEVFRLDLMSTCSRKPTGPRIRCLAWSEVFFAAVRAVGGA